MDSSPWEPEELERLVQESVSGVGTTHQEVPRRQKNLGDVRRSWWRNQRMLRSDEERLKQVLGQGH